MDVEIACLCPTGKHDHDTVTLPEVLDFRRTVTVRQAVRIALRTGPRDVAEMTALLMETYVLHCIDGWSLTDEQGKPLPASRENVEAILLAAIDEAEKVGNAADDLYTETVVLPLLTRAPASSPPTPTPVPTSATTSGPQTKRPRTRSKPSSTSTTPMGVTGPMAASPGGVSSFSPS